MLRNEIMNVTNLWSGMNDEWQAATIKMNEMCKKRVSNEIIK